MTHEQYHISHLPDKRACTIAGSRLMGDSYHQNIALAAAAMVQAGLGEAVYTTQYASGNSYFHDQEGLAYRVALLENGTVAVQRGGETLFVYGIPCQQPHPEPGQAPAPIGFQTVDDVINLLDDLDGGGLIVTDEDQLRDYLEGAGFRATAAAHP